MIIVVHRNQSNQLTEKIEGLSVERTARLISQLKNYGGYLLDSEGLLVEFSLDNEGTSASSDYTIKMVDRRHTSKEIWSVRVDYEEAGSNRECGDECFEKSFKRSFATAYKRGPSLPPVTSKFCPYRIVIRNDAETSPMWLTRELDRLETVVQLLNQVTSSLTTWAASDFRMSVACRDWFCRTSQGAKLLSNDILAEYVRRGLTIDELKSKFVCKRCGKGNPLVAPAR